MHNNGVNLLKLSGIKKSLGEEFPILTKSFVSWQNSLVGNGCEKACLPAEFEIWALRKLGIQAPLKLVICYLDCCFLVLFLQPFTPVSTTVMDRLAVGNVILLDLMAAALTLAGPLTILWWICEAGVTWRGASGWDPCVLFRSIYALHKQRFTVAKMLDLKIFSDDLAFVSLPLLHLLSLTGFLITCLKSEWS
jgi:hypothetical protein